jgi:hypothetical protein
MATSSDDDHDSNPQGFVTNWSSIPVPKNPQRRRKLLKASQTLQSRRERIGKFIDENKQASGEYLQELMKRMPSQHNVNLVSTPRIFMSEADAFEMLCAECLRQESYPQDILNKGMAKGWFDRMNMVAEKYGWVIQLSIRDKT